MTKILKIASCRIRLRRKKRGFTLVELLVVVAILGILAAIAVPRITQSIQSSRVGADIANERIILNALEAYYLEVTATGPRLGYPSKADMVTTAVYGTFGHFFGPLPAVPAGLVRTLYQDRYTPTGTSWTVGGITLYPGFTWTTPNGLGPGGSGTITRP